MSITNFEYCVTCLIQPIKTHTPILNHYIIEELYKIEIPSLDFHFIFNHFFLKKSVFKKNHTSDWKK